MVDYPVHTWILLSLLLLILPGWKLNKNRNLSTLALRFALGESLIFFFLFPILWVDNAPDAVAVCWMAGMVILFLSALGLSVARFTQFKPLVVLSAFLPIIVLVCCQLLGGPFIMS